MSSQQVVVSVLSDIRDFTKGMNDVAQKASGTFKKLGGLVLAGLAAAGIGDWVKGVVEEFTGREDDMGNIGLKYGEKFADGFNSFSFDLSGLGASASEVAELGSTLSASFKSAGLSGEQMKQSLVRILDIQGATGISQDKIAKAWSEATRGKTAGMAKVLGMDKKALDNMIEQEAKTKGISKAQATQNVVMRQTKKMQGEAAKDANTWGGQVEILSAMWSNFGQAIAEKVMPYVIKFSQWFTKNAVPAITAFGTSIQQKVQPYLDAFGAWFNDTALPALQGFGEYIMNNVVPALEGFGQWIQDNAAWLMPLVVAIGTAVFGFQAWTTALGIWKTITTTATAVQAAFNAVMAMNPIGLIIIAIIALVAGLVYFFTQTEVGKQAWAAFTSFLVSAWNTIKTAFSTAIAAVVGFLTKLWDGIKSAWSKILSFFSGIPGKVKSTFSAAGSWLASAGKNIINGLKNGITGAWSTVTSWFGKVKGFITGKFNSAGSWLRGIGGNIIQGLWNGINAAGNWLRDKISGLTGFIPQWIKDKLGIRSPSRVMADIGKYIPQGLAKGIESDNSVMRAMKGLQTDLDTNLELEHLKSGGTINKYYIDGIEIELSRSEQDEFADFMRNLERKKKAGV